MIDWTIFLKLTWGKYFNTDNVGILSFWLLKI